LIGWLLDTHVVAALISPAGAPSVRAWAAAQDEDRMCLSILTPAEIEKGIHNLPAGDPARARYAGGLAALEARFAGRILSLSDAIVRRWGAISGAVRRETGHPPPVIDTLLAATAIEHDLYFVTRNVRDVAHSGAALFNPWTDDPAAFPLAN
jgi:predicted nucleic acid-binding protein